ncbi:MAG TPA: LysR substrate-binding domain-containing protein [Burkholderiales bacterium]|nr:LysR substrate-binding domain-containing protein [Burkholderiales bacterium]
MRLKQVEAFVAAVDGGSLRAAARALRVSQPAITKAIQALETQLHAELLRRTRHGVEPTAVGRSFLRHARIACAEMRKAESVVGERLGTGSVAFGVGPVAALLVVPAALERFLGQHPEAEVRVVEGFAPALLPRVRDGSLDFAMGPRLPGDLDAAFAFRPVFREESAVVCRKGHPLRHAKALSELARGQWLTQWGSGLGPGSIARAFAAAGLPEPRQSVQCESYIAMVALIAQSDVLGVLSRRILGHPLVRDSIEEIRIGDGPAPFTVGLFSRSRAPLSPLGAAMAKAITVSARELGRGAAFQAARRVGVSD